MLKKSFVLIVMAAMLLLSSTSFAMEPKPKGWGFS